VVSDVTKVAKSFETEAVAADKAAVAIAKQAAVTDQAAKSAAALALENAKQSGGGGAGSAEALALSDATDKAKVSKLASRAASDQLAVSEANAAAATQGLGTAAGGADPLLAKLGISGASAGEAFAGIASTVGPAILLLSGLKTLKDGVTNFENLTDQVRKFQLATGASAGQASLLIGQLNTLGIDTDLADKAMFRLGSSLGDGTTKLGQYNVQVARTKDGNVDVVQTFENVRNAYNASADAATKDAIAKAAASRGGAALLPLLNLTVEAQNKLNAATKARGEFLSQSDVDHGYSLKVASAEMALSFQGLELSLSKGIIPDLEAAVSSVSKLVDLVTKASSTPLGKFGSRETLDILTLGLNEVVRATSAKSAADTAAQIKADEHTKSVESLTAAVTKEFDAVKSNDAANRSYNQALLTQTKAQEALSKLEKDGPVDLKAVASAQKEVTNAAKAYESAVDSQAKAQQALQKATAGATAEELAQAQLDVAEGPNKLLAAQAAVEAAQEKLDALQGSGAASASELAAAQAAVQTATFGVTQAQIDAAKAQDNLNTTKAKGTGADPAVISAQQAVADAHDNVASALDAERTAADNLRTAQAGDPEFAQKLADAQTALSDATQGVHDAQDNQQTSAFNLRNATDALTSSLQANAQAIGDVAGKLAAFPGYESTLGQSLNDLTGISNALNDLGGSLPAVFGGIAGLVTQTEAAIASARAKAIAAGLPDPYAAGPTAGPVNTSPGKTAATTTGTIPGRASGGPVDSGQTYLVNEQGAEYLRLGSGTSGYITPHGVAPGGASGPVYNITVYATTGASAQEIARQTAWKLQTVQPPVPTRGQQ
jgi:hypothetical protein